MIRTRKTCSGPGEPPPPPGAVRGDAGRPAGGRAAVDARRERGSGEAAAGVIPSQNGIRRVSSPRLRTIQPAPPLAVRGVRDGDAHCPGTVAGRGVPFRRSAPRSRCRRRRPRPSAAPGGPRRQEAERDGARACEDERRRGAREVDPAAADAGGQRPRSRCGAAGEDERRPQLRDVQDGLRARSRATRRRRAARPCSSREARPRALARGTDERMFDAGRRDVRLHPQRHAASGRADENAEIDVGAAGLRRRDRAGA